MVTIDKSTEKAILDAAKIVFLEKGFDGARMQHIADQAGLNKALIHYYFRNKEKLFDAIFQEAFQQFLPVVVENISADKPLVEKIDVFVDTYINMLQQNPHLPVFILHEISRAPEKMLSHIKNAGINPEIMAKNLNKEMAEGKIRQIDFRHFMVNMIALCIFPFAARPIIQGILFGNDIKAYDVFLSERKEVIKTLLKETLQPINIK